MKEGIIYQSNLEALTNEYWRLERLREEGWNVNSTIDRVWADIADIIHGEEDDKLLKLRGEVNRISTRIEMELTQRKQPQTKETELKNGERLP